MTDVVYPALIVLACIVVALVLHRRTRPAPSRDDLTLPERSVRVGTAHHRLALANWHLEYGDALLDFIDAADRRPASVDTDAILADATEHHPFVEMRAELSAMRASVTALGDAEGRGDVAAAAGHRQVYLAYRSAWLERMWQFPGDADRIDELRRRAVDPIDHDAPIEQDAAIDRGDPVEPVREDAPVTQDDAASVTAGAPDGTDDPAG